MVIRKELEDDSRCLWKAVRGNTVELETPAHVLNIFS